jgi:hypothetical protein
MVDVRLGDRDHDLRRDAGMVVAGEASHRR